ncbi:MAG TPA: CoA-binding protein [Anaeromyxobacteraceae bacterium]
MSDPKLSLAQEFLGAKRIALIGASRNPRDFSRAVMKELLARGYDVVPVNPAGGEIGGRATFATARDVVPAPEAALLMTPPSRTADAVADCLAAGVRRIWLHRGTGAGAASPEALALCRAFGVEPVTDLCPFMVLADTGWFHRVHGYFRACERRRISRRVSGGAS